MIEIIYWMLSVLVTFPLTHVFLKKGMVLDYNISDETYLDLRYDSTLFPAGIIGKLCYPKLGIYLNSLPCDQTIEVEWVDFRRTWEWNTKYDYVYEDKTYNNYIGEIPTEINRLPLWNDQIFIYGVWDSKPNWKQLRQAYERTWWFHRTSDELRDLQLNRLLK